MRFVGVTTEHEIADEELLRHQKKQILKSYVSENSENIKKMKKMVCKFEIKSVGDIVEAGEPFLYNGKSFIANQTHTIQAHQAPGMVGLGALYSVIATEDENGVKEYALNMTVDSGDLVRKDGVVYRFKYHETIQIVAENWAPPFANFWEIVK
ncbi:MAG: hypothetical protein LBU81_00800 [Methanosarcinales archaeon]|jgi:hypothetical protein|nr:hypothetical protein [Methanosarcinales archaeon]